MTWYGNKGTRVVIASLSFCIDDKDPANDNSELSSDNLYEAINESELNDGSFVTFSAMANSSSKFGVITI